MLRCVFVPGRGRYVVAAVPIAAGTVLFREEAYCVAQRVGNRKTKVCVYCCTEVHRASVTCSRCDSVFCCQECAEAHADHHSQSGECSAIILTKVAQKSVPEEDIDTFEMVAMTLGRCAAEGKSDRLGRTLQSSGSTTFETVGLGLEVASPLAFLNVDAAPDTVFMPSYDHVECLGTNLRDTNPEIVDDFSKLYDIYQKTLQHKKYLQQVRTEPNRLPSEVSREIFVGICTAFLCNGFGFWDPVNKQLAVAMYPQSSYFNHSCAPNMGRRNCKRSRVIEFFAARDIDEGESLCISYVDLKLPADERKAKLKATYSFDCACVRCVPEANFVTANTVCCACVPALCGSCISKVMQPLGDGKFTCPCCDEVQEAL